MMTQVMVCLPRWIAVFIQFLLVFILRCSANDLTIDPKGYVVYCPCMGRFGNQADQFLGALAFVKSLDRTMVLPPWVEYGKPGGRPPSVQIPFDTYFQVEPLAEYHRVITMEVFMKNLAPKVWPIGKRKGFCYTYRQDSSCMMKEGNPFGPFWDNFKVDFDSYVEYGAGLNYEASSQNARKWNERFPASSHPVLAFGGAPGSFPVQEQNVPLHKFLVWSKFIEKQANDFIAKNIPEGPFLGLHMRNGVDWVNVCDNHIGKETNRHLFGSPQCLGYHFEHGQVTQEMCFPPRDLVKKQVRRRVKKMKAKVVFVAADADPMIAELTKMLEPYKVKVVQFDDHEPHVELAILAKSDHYIGNCISTFSAFAARERLMAHKTNSFWAVDNLLSESKPKKKRKIVGHVADEL
ncbi:GDP-fucose protein O-fucosyltransferase 1-like [Asterias rubens]|uniref:GDP-fucose protein O-fucosyltransferase 1-like n=1 Tax=Asterias rubens TaxID=7604 RepID=UPI001455A933|nr:GDP-fucose protein O-fucosyltransferase 1-like [Asterias rubens]XP_033643157.1 GDP-fucose protein O-fucosyltransferase 1-like [Asterias rubens]